jgi:hypothetical protein
MVSFIDARGGGGGKGTGKYRSPPRANFKTLVNKNAIKPEIGGPPQAIFPESLDPPPRLLEFWQKLQGPRPLDFQPVFSL